MTIAGLTLAIATKAITVKEALLKSGYQEDEISRARIKAASKRKCRIVNDVLSKKKKAKCSEYYVNARIKNKSNPTSTSTSSPREASSVSSIVDVFSERVQRIVNEQVKECQRLNEINKENCPTLKTMNKRSKLLSKKNRRTSKQLNAYLVEKHEVDEKKKKAYEWAVKEVVEKNVKTAAEAARRATELFDIPVLADTIRKLIKSECNTVRRSGPKGKFSEEEMGTLEVAVLSYVSLSQANCGKEKTSRDLMDLVQSVVRKAAEGRQLQDSRAFWRRMQGRLASNISLDKESLIELRRQIWTTYSNLSTWYDGWEKIVLDRAFASRSEDGSVHFSEVQKRRMINLDETKLSIDGSDGGIGGRPANVIVIKSLFCSGTATNKTNVSSTLMCGLNAAGKFFNYFF
jgi:hypothetical protein